MKWVPTLDIACIKVLVKAGEDCPNPLDIITPYDDIHSIEVETFKEGEKIMIVYYYIHHPRM